MKTLNLLITSKNKKSLKIFFNVLNKNFLIINFNSIIKKFQKKLKKTTITILKSPHVNKTAQEQFEIKYISKQIQICTTNLFKLLIFIKKLNFFLFPDINVKVKLIYNQKKLNYINKKILNIDYFYYRLIFLTKINKIQSIALKTNRLKLFNNINKTLISIDSQKLLKLFDTYGK